MHTLLNPMRTARAVELIKKQKNIARNYQRLFGEAEKANAPLWTENKRLRDLVASLERSLRTTADHRDSLQRRLDILSCAISSVDSDA